jgi:hypothetical protein
MTDDDRFRLLFGPYGTPHVRLGTILTCESRDCDVIVVGYTDAKIPWPIGRRRGSSARGPVVYGRLADAVRRESNQSICHWWGVTPQTVTKWRKALGVDRENDGTARLDRDYVSEKIIIDGVNLGAAKANDPDRRAKIAAARRGKPRPRHVIAAMRKGRKGKPHSAEARRKMSAAQRRCGAWPPAAGRPWTIEEDRLVKELPAAEVVQKTGRTLSAVYGRRSALQVPDGRQR